MAANEVASDRRAAPGEVDIEVYDQILPAHAALEDEGEIASTDDV